MLHAVVRKSAGPSADTLPYWEQEGVAFGLAKSCCHQLESQFLSAAMTTQVTRKIDSPTYIFMAEAIPFMAMVIS